MIFIKVSKNGKSNEPNLMNMLLNTHTFVVWKQGLANKFKPDFSFERNLPVTYDFTANNYVISRNIYFKKWKAEWSSITVFILKIRQTLQIVTLTINSPAYFQII